MPPSTPHDFIINLVQLHANMKKQALYFAWHNPEAVRQAQAIGNWLNNDDWPYQFYCCARSPQEIQPQAPADLPGPKAMTTFEPGGSFQVISVPQSVFPELHQPDILSGLENYIVEGGYAYLALDNVPLAVALMEHPKSMELLKEVATEVVKITTAVIREVTAQRETAAINAIKSVFGEGQ